MTLISAFRPPSVRSTSLRHRSGRARRRSAVRNEDDEDAHSIITPSKHTPKPLRILKGSVASGGLLNPFRLLKQDFRHLRQRWVSDWTVFNQLIFASAVYVFFTNLLPGITFASDLYQLTGQTWGAIEVVLSTGLCGIIFSLFSIQPLTILGVTGPFSVLAENIYSLCHDSFNIDFLPFMAWSLIHAGWMHYILAIINAHDFTMRYVTTFSTEIFSLLNSIIYFHKAIQELQRAHDTLSFAAFLYAVIGAVGTMLLAIFLSTAESWKPLFHRYVRLALTEYAAAISIIIFIGLPHVGELAHLDKSTLHVSSSFRPTLPSRSSFFVPFWHLELKWIFAALLPGLIITILFFFDHEVSSIICTIDRYGVRKPGGYAWDIVLLGTTTAICGILGIPPANGLLPQAPLHSESLMHTEIETVTITNPDTEEPTATSSNEPHTTATTTSKTVTTRRVYEQRWSAFLHSAGILIFTSPPLMKVLGLTPTSVLAGLFLFMGEQSLSVNPILYRLFYLLTPTSELPPLPASTKTPSKSNKNQTKSPPKTKTTNPQSKHYAPIHAYTILQLAITIAIFALTLTKAAPAFPLLIVALVPLRLLLVKRWWSRGVLVFVDAWACRPGAPGDDDDEIEQQQQRAGEERQEDEEDGDGDGDGDDNVAGAGVLEVQDASRDYSNDDVWNSSARESSTADLGGGGGGGVIGRLRYDEDWVELGVLEGGHRAG